MWTSFYGRIHVLSKKNGERKECSGCKSYNPECRQGACSLYPYKVRKVITRNREEYDTS